MGSLLFLPNNAVSIHSCGDSPVCVESTDCGSFLIGRTFFVNMYAYVFMAFLLSISGMFICDRHFQNIKNRSVNENFNSKHQMPFSNSIFMSCHQTMYYQKQAILLNEPGPYPTRIESK